MDDSGDHVFDVPVLSPVALRLLINLLDAILLLLLAYWVTGHIERKWSP